MLHLTLYKYANKPIIVDKSSYLGTGLVVTGDAMTSNQDMENPVVLLSFTSEPDYNYAYIQEYHRYYYLAAKVWVSANVWSMTFKVDELYTYKATAKSVSGLVAYSASGSMMKYDSRLNYNKALTRVATSSANTSSVDGAEYLILLRYHDSRRKNDLDQNSYRSSAMAYTYMNELTFGIFMHNYTRLFVPSDPNYNEALGVAISKIIVDVSFVHYMKFPSSAPANWYENAVNFTTMSVTKLNNNQTVSISTLDGLVGGFCKTYFLEDYYPFDRQHIDFSILNSYYWDRIAKYTVHLPWLGDIKFNLTDMGQGNDSILNLSLDIRHEPGENVYVVTPYTTSVGGTETYYPELRQIYPVSTTAALPIDESFNQYKDIADLKMFSLAATSMSAIPTAWMTSGMSLLNMGNMATQFGGTMLELENLKVNDALSSTFKGITGGSPSNVFTVGAGNYDKPVLIKDVVPPASDYASFWSDHGLPDGAYRSLASMTGYVQMQEFEMIYDSNATVGEMQRLEAQLYKGVIL